MKQPMGQFEGVDIDQIYREHLLDHYNNPRNFGELQEAEHAHDLNPTCGDELDMYARFKDDEIEEIRFKGDGCAISVASASMLTEKAEEMDVKELAGLEKDDMEEMLGIEVSMARVKCMMLSLKILKKIIYKQLGGNENVESQ